MPKSSKSSSSGCFSSLLRHLLCRNSVPKYPPTEPDAKKQERLSIEEAHLGKEVAPSLSSLSDRPGIVARLMGLETLPADAPWDPREHRKSPDSVPRSRSVNFMDYMLEIDVQHVSRDSGHRRVRTSVSFREDVAQAPEPGTGRHQDLLVLYIDELEKNELKKKEPREKLDRRRWDRLPAGKERKVPPKPRNIEPGRVRNEPEARVDHQQYGRKSGKQRGKMILEKEVMAESRFTKKRRDKEGKAGRRRVAVVPVDSDGSEAALSPISVLELDHCVDDQQGMPSTSQERKAHLTLSPKRDFSPPRTFQQPAARVPDPSERRGCPKGQRVKDSAHSTVDAPPLEITDDYCLAVAVEVYRLTADDIAKSSSSWADLNGGKAEKEFRKLCEEISASIERQVLEQLVGDLCITS